MRILHILDHSLPLHSGYTFRTCAILQEQHKLGWQTFHVTSSKHVASRVPEEDVDGFHFYRTFSSDVLWARLPVLNQVEVIRSLGERLLEVVKQVQPDILHAHSPALNGIAALRVARRCGLPLVYEMRALWEDAASDHGSSREGGLRYRASRALETYVLKKADLITTICEGLRQEIGARAIAQEKVTVVPNAVDSARFSRRGVPDMALKSSLGLDKARVLGFIGSFYGYEGLTLLLGALPEVCKEFPDAKLLLVGGGYEEVALKALSVENGLADRVVFAGRVPHSEVQRYYDLIDILVYPRLAMRLTELVTPLKPLEAMAQGRLLIASDVGGHRELIVDGETGVLFQAGDKDDLTAKIVDLLRHGERWSDLQEQARNFVETERTWERSVANYRLVYGKLLGTTL